MKVSPILSPILSSIFLSLGAAACQGGSAHPDATVTDLDGLPADGGAGIDGVALDAARSDAAPFDCYSSSGYHVFGIGGAAGEAVIELTLGPDPTSTDGIYGIAALALDDVAAVAGAGKLAVDGDGVWHLDDPAVLGGAMTETRLGDAPGVRALAYASNAGLFGASGLEIARITPAPFAVESLGQLDVPGCTGIADLAVAMSDTTAIFSLALDCTGGDRYARARYDAGIGLAMLDGPYPAGPADLGGIDALGYVTSGDNLYQVDAAGVFTVVRPLSGCVGEVRGID